MRLKAWPERIAIASLAGAAAWFLVALVRASRPDRVVSYDIYTFFYPTMVIAAQNVLAGGKGLLWNPFHACGQPFFALGTTGLLYPPAVLSLVLPPDWALYGLLFFNLTVGAASTYLLCRELRLGVVAAWCGALAFTLSNTSTDLITATPLVSGPYAWLPAAMLFCERLLREPTVRRAVGLAVTIALALIPGHPQLVFYLYQLIALRVLWELLTQRGAVGLRTLGLFALGLVLPPLLVAVQFLPTLEVMQASIRNADLSLKEISVNGYLTWESIRRGVVWHWDVATPLVTTPWVLAGVAFFDRAKLRVATFYALAGAAACVLALGPNGFLFEPYMRLPLGSLFGYPSRFLWITSFCVAVLAAHGVDALLVSLRPSSSGRRRAGVVLGLLVAALAYHLITRPGLGQVDWIPVEIAVAVVAVVAAAPRLHTLAAGALALAMVLDLIALRATPFRRLLPDGAVLFSQQPLFRTLRERLTSQDRIYLAPRHADYALQQKTGSLFRVPVLFDYEAQPTRRWASYFVRMRTGHPMTRLTDWGFMFGGWFPPSFKRRLLDLAAARYVVVAAEEDKTRALQGAPLRPIPALSNVRVYENPTALPRAAYVPRIAVVPDPDALLDRLATGNDDLRQLALVEEPASDFLGEPAAPGPPIVGTVTFETDDPEHVQLRVRAPRRGFVILADQWFPGWQATVDGARVPIVRANYLFRLVEAPAGESVVDFRYRPRSVALGALVSTGTALGVAVLLVRTRRRPA